MLFSMPSLWSIFFLIYVLVIVLVIVLERKRPEKTISWLLVIALLPPIGIFLYIFLGRNWKVHKLNKDFSPKIKELIFKVINKIEDPEYIPLIALLAQNSESPLFVYNDITIFNNGQKKFDALKKSY
ncbi:cardiolipin synthetase 2 [Clostridium tetanomorphum]|nr:cardiolipin synthetase 2 [Clostridium tetanomorphum]